MGLENLPSRLPDKTGQITPEKVTTFYAIRDKIWGMTSIEELGQIANSLGIIVDGLHDEFPSPDEKLASMRKKIFGAFFMMNFPHSSNSSREEHERRLDEIVDSTIRYFKDVNTTMAVGVFGSYANGVVNGPCSDLDFLIIFPKIDSWQAGEAELEKIRDLEKIGYVFSNKLGPLENIIPIMSTGWGLARLYGMTTDGVETEFHIIGEKDAQAMPLLYPAFTQRLKPVSPKLELRTSFTGERKSLPKGPDRVPKYIIVEEEANKKEVYIGFFPLQISITDFIHDPNNIGLHIQDKIWKALVKAFFYHNGVIERTDDGLTVYLEKIPLFEHFLKIHYYNNPEKYSPERLEWMRARYYKACNEVVDWYKLRGLKIVLGES